MSRLPQIFATLFVSFVFLGLTTHCAMADDSVPWFPLFSDHFTFDTEGYSDPTKPCTEPRGHTWSCDPTSLAGLSETVAQDAGTYIKVSDVGVARNDVGYFYNTNGFVKPGLVSSYCTLGGPCKFRFDVDLQFIDPVQTNQTAFRVLNDVNAGSNNTFVYVTVYKQVSGKLRMHIKIGGQAIFIDEGSSANLAPFQNVPYGWFFQNHVFRVDKINNQMDGYLDGTLLRSGTEAMYWPLWFQWGALRETGYAGFGADRWTALRSDYINVYAAPKPAIAVSPSAVSFATVTKGSASPQTISFSTWDSGPVGTTLNWTAAECSYNPSTGATSCPSSVTWFAISPLSGSHTSTSPPDPPNSVFLILDTTAANGLVAGTYNARVRILDANATNNPQYVNVSLTVAAVPTISVDPTTLSFSANYGEVLTLDETFQVWNSGSSGTTLSFTISTDWGATTPWFSFSPSSGTSTGSANKESITVSLLNTSAMAAGTYSQPISVSSADATNSPQTVTVNLTIVALTQPAILVNPITLNFSINYGEAASSNDTFTVSNSGPVGTTLNFSVTANWGATTPWFGFAPASGTSTSPADLKTITVTLQNTDTLAVGNYSQAISIADASASNSPQSVTVNLTVNSVTSTPTLAVIPLMLNFGSTTQGTPLNGSQSFVVYNDVLGGSTLNWTAVESAVWFQISPAFGDSNDRNDRDSVFVTLDSSAVSSLAVGNYNESVTVSGQSGAINSPLTVTISLVITAPVATVNCSVFGDASRDGVRDAGENLITTGSMTISYDSVPPTTQNVLSGVANFINVPAGIPLTFTLGGILPAGYNPTRTSVDGAPCSPGGSCTVTLSSGVVTRVDFGIWTSTADGWYQSINGDVYASGVDDPIPTTVGAGYERYFIAANPNTTGGGVPVTSSPEFDLNGAPESEREAIAAWNVLSYTQNWPSLSPTAVSPIEIHPTAYTINSGNVGTYSSGQHIVVVSNGNLVIDGSVSSVNVIHALLIVLNGEIQFNGVGGNEQINIKGGMYAKNGIDMSAKSLSDNSVPAVVVEFDPQYFLLNTIPSLIKSHIIWKEVK